MIAVVVNRQHSRGMIGIAKELIEIPDSIKTGLTIFPVSRMDEVLDRAMTRKPEPIAWDETATTQQG